MSLPFASQWEELPVGITLQNFAENYPVLHIEHEFFVADVAIHGAHVISWKPRHMEQDVFYVSPDAIYQEGKAIRGGIPICWPWFNVHANDATKPAHGFVRNRYWTLKTLVVEKESVNLLFVLDPSDIELAKSEGFDQTRLEFLLTFGETFRMELITINEGAEPVSFEEALHTYFKVGDIEKISIHNLSGIKYWDTVGTPTWREQDGDVKIHQEVDRQYATADDVELVDPVLRRVIKIKKTGSQETVVWNPWIDKAKNLKDLPNEAYHDFVCIETANTRQSPVSLLPGEQHVIACEICAVKN